MHEIAQLADERSDLLTVDQVLGAARSRIAAAESDATERRLPNLAPVEAPFVRVMWIVIATVLVWGHFYVVRSFWAPAHPGVDQNGYQVGGKLFSQSFSTGFKPPNPFSYVGWMWVQSPNGWMYPKYPLGVPVLDAFCIWIAHDLHQGVVWSYLVSPLCTVLAAAAMFLMLRMFASSFAAVLGLILMASNPVALVLANNSNSHAPALAFASWGILFLLWWMRYGGACRGFIAGLLLGYALTIRYTEGLLVLPIAAAMLTSIRYHRAKEVRWVAVAAWIVLVVIGVAMRTRTNVPVAGWRGIAAIAGVGVAIVVTRRFGETLTHAWRYLGEIVRAVVCGAIVWCVVCVPRTTSQFKDPIGTMIAIDFVKVIALGMIPILYAIRWDETRTYLRPIVIVAGWMIPVAALVTFNKFALGSWTGYDTTNESEGFSWNYFVDKWDFMVGQVYNTGLFFVAPLGIAGMILMYRRSARVATVMLLWFVPGLLLYAAYYWGLNTPGVAYLRFFLTLFPAMVFCAVSLLDDLSRRGISRRGLSRGAIAAPIAAGVVVAIASGLNVYSSRGALERDFAIQMNLADTGEQVLRATKDPYEADSKRRPLLFGEARGFLNYMQYAGNFECYSAEAFTQRGGNRMWRNVDPDAPNPLQKVRVDQMRKLYEGKSESDLEREETKIVNQALADQRHVYSALPTLFMGGFRSRFPTTDFNIQTVAQWHEPVTMSDEARKAFTALGPAALFLGGRTMPQSWTLVEITKKYSKSATIPPADVANKSTLSRIASKLRSSRATAPATQPVSTQPKALFEIK